MDKKQKQIIAAVAVAWFIGLMIWYLHGKNFAILNPKGFVAYRERSLMITTVLLGLIVVVPVYVMLFGFAWRYREGNKKAKYSPDLAGNRLAEAIWWGIPLTIIGILSVITWQSSHALDPRRALDSQAKPMTIEVVALDWKWLFIYPNQHVASINWVEIPTGTPVTFDVTSDAPMNSFWIPQLGSQIYAMPGMSTQVHLVADKAGDYQGSSANLSGDGFAGMRFTAEARPQADFDRWVTLVKRMPGNLDKKAYARLAKPSKDNPAAFYSSVEPDLYTSILLKYMAPERQ